MIHLSVVWIASSWSVLSKTLLIWDVLGIDMRAAFKGRPWNVPNTSLILGSVSTPSSNVWVFPTIPRLLLETSWVCSYRLNQLRHYIFTGRNSTGSHRFKDLFYKNNTLSPDIHHKSRSSVFLNDHRCGFQWYPPWICIASSIEDSENTWLTRLPVY